MEDIYRNLQVAFAKGSMDAGTNFQKAKDNIANGGDLRYSKSAKVFFAENVFPPYNKSQSDAHEWAERWAQSESAQVQNKKLVPYHNRWYLIQAFDDMKYGYQIIERIKAKDYKKVAEYYGILTGYESVQDTSRQNAALLRETSESGRAGHRPDFHATRHRRENSEIHGMGTAQNGRREADGNSTRNSESGGEDSRRENRPPIKSDTSGNPDIRYSVGRKTDRAVQEMLDAENRKLQENVAKLKKLLKLQGQETGGTKFTASSVLAAARYIKKLSGSKANTNELSGMLNDFYEYIANNKVEYVNKKEPPHFCGGFVFALPIFPGSRPPSIVGVHELNFCVRDGNRWTLMTINTNYYIVQLSLLQPLVTHTGFEPMLTA